MEDHSQRPPSDEFREHHFAPTFRELPRIVDEPDGLDANPRRGLEAMTDDRRDLENALRRGRRQIAIACIGTRKTPGSDRLANHDLERIFKLTAGAEVDPRTSPARHAAIDISTGTEACTERRQIRFARRGRRRGGRATLRGANRRIRGTEGSFRRLRHRCSGGRPDPDRRASVVNPPGTPAARRPRARRPGS